MSVMPAQGPWVGRLVRVNVVNVGMLTPGRGVRINVVNSRSWAHGRTFLYPFHCWRTVSYVPEYQLLVRNEPGTGAIP